MVRQEIYGYLLTHHAIPALICQAATEADIDPDRVKFTRTVRIVRRATGPAAEQLDEEELDWYEAWARARLEPVLGPLRVTDRKGGPPGMHGPARRDGRGRRNHLRG
jgi:hypothetical protein